MEEEEIFAATAEGLAIMGLARAMTTVIGVEREEAYGVARERFVKAFRHFERHPYLGIEGGTVREVAGGFEVTFVVEGLGGFPAGCRERCCFLGRIVEPMPFVRLF